jgi:hypothetical protein
MEENVNYEDKKQKTVLIAQDVKTRFFDLIMSHGAPLALAVAFIIYIDYKDSNQEIIYLKAIEDLRKDKIELTEYNKEMIEEIVECYKSGK